MASGWNIRTASDLALATSENWDERVRNDRTRKEKLSRREGKENTHSMVVAKTDESKGHGSKLYIDMESELFQDPTIGEDDSAGDAAKPTLNQQALTVRTYRFFEAFTKVANRKSFLTMEKNIAGRLGRRIARYRDTSFSKELKSPAAYTQQDGSSITPSPTVFYGGRVSDIASLTNLCQLDAAELSKGRLILESHIDALPLSVRNSDDSEIDIWGVYVDRVSLYNLGQDPVIQNALRVAMPPGWDNPIFTGALFYYDGLLITEWRGIVQGCHQGSPWRPECALLATTNSGADELVVGLDNKKNYLENMDEIGTLEIVSAAGTDETLAYDNSGLTSAEKRYKFHLTGTTSHEHTAHDLITQQNHNATILYHGAEVGVRGYGKPDEQVGDVWDAGMQLKLGVEGVFGQSAILDSDGNVANYALQKVYAKNPAIV